MRTVALLLTMTALTLAQTPVSEKAAKFEVASIKPTSTQDGSFAINFPPGGRFSARNITVHNLLRSAYGLEDYQIAGGPAWINSPGFDIEAKAEAVGGGVPREQILTMIQSLLADRFRMAMHRETQQLPVYNLVVGKTGVRMQAADPDAEEDRSLRMGHLIARRMSMTTLGNLLAFDLKRPVKDETGLSGEFAFTLDWTRGLGESDAGQSSGPSLFTAVQEQLGLKLESAKGPVEVLVIDRLEKPSEN
jgi:uncharacterized protein (TIGR03435 family)